MSFPEPVDHLERSASPTLDAHTPSTEFDTNIERTSAGDAPAGAVSIEDVPPDGGYGWICTACVFMINAHTWGLNAVSIYMAAPQSVVLIGLGMGHFPRLLSLKFNIPRGFTS